MIDPAPSRRGRHSQPEPEQPGGTPAAPEPPTGPFSWLPSSGVDTAGLRGRVPRRPAPAAGATPPRPSLPGVAPRPTVQAPAVRPSATPELPGGLPKRTSFSRGLVGRVDAVDDVDPDSETAVVPVRGAGSRPGPGLQRRAADRAPAARDAARARYSSAAGGYADVLDHPDVRGHAADLRADHAAGDVLVPVHDDRPDARVPAQARPITDRHQWDPDDEPPHDDQFHDDQLHDDQLHDDQLHDDRHDFPVFDETGGLEVIGAGGHDEPRRRGRRGSGDDGHDDGGDHDGHSTRRRGRRPLSIVASLIVLAALVAGVFFGGRALLNTINPTAEDYTGTGTGDVQVRVNSGDTLRDIGKTLADADVIASVSPFTDAARANPAATGIQPGVYGMHQQMSGQAALDLMLDPASRLSFGVVLREGLTVTQSLQALSDATQLPLDQFQAAAADTVAIGLPGYANGLLEGFLFPATYTFDLDATPTEMLTQMVSRTVQTLDELAIPEDQRLTVLTKASLVQAESGSVEDMGMVARVIENRLADGMMLQFDTTVNYANNKSGLTTTPEDRLNPSPYNTYVVTGLPPGAIDSPGEDALRAVLAPTPGDWLFFVVVDPDTGETRFAVTEQEHAANVELFRQWLAENPGG